MQCGTKLPDSPERFRPKSKEGVGKAHGIEPDKDHLYDEPSFTGGKHKSSEKEKHHQEHGLPFFLGSETFGTESDSSLGSEISSKPKGGLVTLFIILAILLPPLGIILTFIMGLIPTYRTSCIPVLGSAVLGAAFWGWGIWATQLDTIYNEPVEVINDYISAQNWCYQSSGQYSSVLELKIQGYLPPDWPEDLNRNNIFGFTLNERVLGPTGYQIEMSPPLEESSFYNLESLWFDHTGEIRIGNPDGEILEIH